MRWRMREGWTKRGEREGRRQREGEKRGEDRRRRMGGGAGRRGQEGR